MTLWTNFFLDYGGEFLDAKGNILTDGPEAIEATKLYQTLLTKVAPPGVAGFNWMESMASFTQGRVGDVDRRRRLGAAAGRSGRVAHRRQGRLRRGAGGTEGPVFGDLWRRHRHRGGQQEEGSRLSAVPVGGLEAQGARLLQAGGGVPFRNSILNDAEVQQGREDAEGMAPSVIDAAKISKLGLPVVIPVAEFRDLVGAAVTATLSGADPATELKKAHEQFRPILERSEKA